MVEVAQRTAGNTQASGSGGKRHAGWLHGGGSGSPAHHNCLHRASCRGRKGRNVGQCRRSIARNPDPGIPCARLPHPAKAGHKHPVTVTIRHPSPRIGGSIHVPDTRIEAPSPVHKRIPASAGEIWLPHHAIAGDCREGPVVVQVAEAISVRCGIILGVLVVV